jgi:CDP-glucose 4,6-dehydratase
VRPWQHVLEPLSGYLILAEKLFSEGPAYAEGWNFGPADEDAKPVQWIVEQLAAQWGEGASWQLDSNPQPHEAHYLKLDCSKARAKLGWHPRWDLQTTLESIIRWHKQAPSGDNMQMVSLRQIAEYQSHIHP